jgi:hypothetical protein
MTTTRASRAALADALTAVRSAIGTHVATAELLGMSRKSLERYIYEHGLPPKARRPGMLHALSGHVDAALIAKLGVALEVPEAHWPQAVLASRKAPPIADAPAAALQAHIEVAIFAAAERFNVPAAQARLVAFDVLSRIVQLGVNTEAAHMAVAAIVTKRAPGARSA